MLPSVKLAGPLSRFMDATTLFVMASSEPVETSRTTMRTTVNQLNMSWTVAAANALRKDSLSAACKQVHIRVASNNNVSLEYPKLVDPRLLNLTVSDLQRASLH